jgi:hypothetical protein
MAQTNNKEIQKGKKPPLFRKHNYILMGIAVLLLIIGYILLGGGKSPSPEQFSEEIFNARRLIISPVIILVGLIVGIVAIMYHPKKKTTTAE